VGHAPHGLGDVILRHRPWEEAADFRIGLRPIAPDAWLEGGEADPAARKDPLYAKVRPLVWAETPASRPSQAEVLELVEAALGPAAECRRDLPPLYAAARRTPDDLCLMEKRDGAWRLTALSLSAGSFFTAHQVIGKSLGELHGPVTGFGERFLVRVQRIFEGLRPELILERRNWTVLNADALHTPSSAPIRARIGEIAPEDAGHALRLRVERQTLRRLPRTGGALFTIRVWLAPLASLADEPARLAAFAGAWRSATPDLRAYKRFDLYDDLVESFLSSHAMPR
jgi:heme-dependent oxidative N-demethylase alpha subunit-like protein